MNKGEGDWLQQHSFQKTSQQQLTEDQQSILDGLIAGTCQHTLCTECRGTGRKQDGTQCVHFISCPCPRCTPRC